MGAGVVFGLTVGFEGVPAECHGQTLRDTCVHEESLWETLANAGVVRESPREILAGAGGAVVSSDLTIGVGHMVDLTMLGGPSWLRLAVNPLWAPF